MVPMKALVGFSMAGVTAAAEAKFEAPDAKTADALVAAGVAERAKADRAEPRKTGATSPAG